VEHVCAVGTRLLHDIEAGFSLFPEEYLKLLTNLTGALDGKKAVSAKGIPVLVSGSIVEQMWIFDLLEAAGGQVVAETYSAAWSIRLDTSNPLEALAMKSLQSYPMVSCVSMTRRKEMVLKACRDYHIDGVILHSNKSCLPITLGQMDIKRALQQELGVPEGTPLLLFLSLETEAIYNSIININCLFR